MKTLWIALLLGLVAALLMGCEPEAMDTPPKIRFGQAECVHCGMIVSDARAAGAIVAEVDGQRRDLAFDDIGCMGGYEAVREDLQVLSRWVGDYATGAWAPVNEASLLRSDSLHTPMGSGVIGFADPAAAERKRADAGGEFITYAELVVSSEHSDHH